MWIVPIIQWAQRSCVTHQVKPLHSWSQDHWFKSCGQHSKFTVWPCRDWLILPSWLFVTLDKHALLKKCNANIYISLTPAVLTAWLHKSWDKSQKVNAALMVGALPARQASPVCQKRVELYCTTNTPGMLWWLHKGRAETKRRYEIMARLSTLSDPWSRGYGGRGGVYRGHDIFPSRFKSRGGDSAGGWQWSYAKDGG